MKIDVDLTINNIVTENIIVTNSAELTVLGTVNGNITIEYNSSSIIYGVVNGIVYNYGSCEIFGTINGNVIGENIKIDQNAIINEKLFRLTTEQETILYLSLIKQGLNDGQISDVFQKIKNEEDYLKYLKY